MSRNAADVKRAIQTTGSTSANKHSPAQSSDQKAHLSPLNKLFAAEEEAALAATGGKTNGVFTEYTDVSKVNDEAHNDGRLDTFKTPVSSHKRFNTPLRADKRWGLGDTHDLIEICEAGFAKSMRFLGKEILKDSKEELAKAIGIIKNDKLESKAREDSTETMLLEVHRLVQQVHEATSAPSKPAVSNADLAPLMAYLDKGEAARCEAQREMLQQLEAQFTANISKVREDMIDLMQHHDVTEKVPELLEEMQKSHQKITEMCQRSEAQLAKLVSMQESLVEEVAKRTEMEQQIEIVGKRYSGTLESILEARLLQIFGTHSVKVDFAQIVGRVAMTERSVIGEIDCLGQEIAKIQQALHLDFAQVINGVMEIGNRMSDGSEKDASQASIVAESALVPIENNRVSAVVGGRQTTVRGRRGAGGTDTSSVHIRGRRRVREFFTQTETAEMMDQWTMTDKSLTKKPKKKLKDLAHDALGPQDTIKPAGKAVFADAEAMRQKARQAAIRPPYNVFDYYYREGRMQAIAKSRIFEWLTLGVIFLNSLWISVDTDLNNSETLVGADPVFVTAENLFCSYFTIEISIRFLAFDGKTHCLFDPWFVFDTFLVTLMVFETWIVTLVFLMLGGFSGTDVAGKGTLFRVIRLVKMLRISRLTRLLRSIPELVIIIKGIGAASRSVVIFLAMWLIVVYIFAILFRQVTDATDIGNKYFQTVPLSMNTLLVDGILPDNEGILSHILESNPFVWLIFLMFILLACITLMYMLVGVLVDVISSIAASEKESMTVSHVANELRDLVYDEGDVMESPLTKHQFEKLIVRPEVAHALTKEGVDVVALMDMADVIFEDIEKQGKNGGGMGFEQLVELVLNMRGTNPATVKDMKEQLRVVKALMIESSKMLTDKLTSDLKELKQYIVDLREHHEREADSDDSDHEHLHGPYRESQATYHGYRDSAATAFTSVDDYAMPHSTFDHEELPRIQDVEDVE